MNEPEKTLTVQDVLAGALGNTGLSPQESNIGGTRAYNNFVRLLPLMPKEIQEGFKNKTLQYENVAYYSVEGFGATATGTATMFPSDRSMGVGITNVGSGKLEDGKPAVIVVIYLEYSAAATAAGFTRAAIPAAMNGELKFRIDEKDIVKVGLHSFKQVEGYPNVYAYEIDGKLIPDKKIIEATIQVTAGGSTAGGSGNFFRMTLEGLGVRSK